MTTIHINPWGYEMARERQLQLIEVAAQERLRRAAAPAAKRWPHWLQPLAHLKRGRLVAPRLHWSSPVDEAPCR